MPLRETAFQGYTFLALLYVGLLSSFLLDLLSPLIRGCSFFPRLLLDLFLSVFTSFLCFLALASTHCDRPRLYMFFAFLTGACLYRFGVRTLATAIWNFFRSNRKNKANGE